MGDVNGAPRNGPSIFGMQPQGQMHGGGYQSPGMTKGGGSPMMGGPQSFGRPAMMQVAQQMGGLQAQMPQGGGGPSPQSMQAAYAHYPGGAPQGSPQGNAMAQLQGVLGGSGAPQGNAMGQMQGIMRAATAQVPSAQAPSAGMLDAARSAAGPQTVGQTGQTMGQLQSQYPRMFSR